MGFHFFVDKPLKIDPIVYLHLYPGPLNTICQYHHIDWQVVPITERLGPIYYV